MKGHLGETTGRLGEGSSRGNYKETEGSSRGLGEGSSRENYKETG